MAIRDSQNNLLGSHALGETIYEYDWFSGSQINVMMGDILIDSAVAIDFSVQQSKVPVFGYASQYYSFLADGHVIVQGTMTIAFKEAGYLLYPAQRFNEIVAKNIGMFSGEQNWNQIHTQNVWTSPRYSIDENGNLVNGYNPDGDFSLTKASKEARKKQVLQANVEQMMEWKNNPDGLGDGAARKKYNKFWRELGALPDNQFEDWAETFEDAIWYGSDISNPLVREKMFSKNIKAGETIEEEDVLQHRRLDQYPPVDILITYGDMSRQPANHTVKKLLDVSFVGQAQSIEISGQPIYEQYQFIARNIA